MPSSFEQLILPQITDILRPVHITLAHPQSGLRSLIQTIHDPSYANVHSHMRHHSTYAPYFDVREDDNAFYLEGEFPGVETKDDIVIEELGSRTFSVEAKTARFDLSKEWSDVGDNWDSGSEQKESDVRDDNLTKKVLCERHIGYLQRSFTFITPVNIKEMRVKLRHGLLVIKLPKVQDTEKHSLSRIGIED